MTARPLDEILPQRAAVRWIRARGWIQPRARRLLEAVWRAWFRAMPWFAGAAIVLAYLLICTWLDRRDAEASFETATRAITVLQRDNTRLRSRLAEREAVNGTRPLFYLIESDSLDAAADKLRQVAMTIAGDAYDMNPVIPREKKK